MGTEVKLKREAIERRIAELEGKMPDIQASKEGAEGAGNDPQAESAATNLSAKSRKADLQSQGPIHFRRRFRDSRPHSQRGRADGKNRMRDEHRRNPHLLRD